MGLLSIDGLPATWSFSEMLQALYQAPACHLVFEAVLIIGIVKLFFSKTQTIVLTEKYTLNKREKNRLIKKWTPLSWAPVVPDDDPALVSIRKHAMNSQSGKYVTQGNAMCLNMGSFDFHNFSGDEKITKEVMKGLQDCPAGPCGQQGFYSTMEGELAQFMGCEKAIVYSYGFATFSSIIPAFLNQLDIVFCDVGVSSDIQNGVQVLLCNVQYFRHNDMDHLEQLLMDLQEDDKRVELKYKYKVHIFLEESCSFGVLGRTGRGVTEHFNIDVGHIELIAASLENSLASIGGFCVGWKYMLDHQWLLALGNCFAASQPPMLASAALHALRLINSNPGMVQELQDKSRMLHEALSSLPHLSLFGEPISPIKHLYITKPYDDWDVNISMLQTLTDQTRTGGVVFTVARYVTQEELSLPTPSIRIIMTRAITPEEVDLVKRVLETASNRVLGGR